MSTVARQMPLVPPGPTRPIPPHLAPGIARPAPKARPTDPKRSSHRRGFGRVITASLTGALLILGLWVVTSPAAVSGSTGAVKFAACAANLRTSPSPTAPIKYMVNTTTRMTMIGTVTGSAFQTTCGGRTAKSAIWAKVTGIAGRSVSSLVGRPVLYVASTLLKDPTVPVLTRYVRCSANIRTGASTSAAVKTTLSAGKVVSIQGVYPGSAYSTTCAGAKVSSTSWARIVAIGGKSVQSLYGVSALWTAGGLLSTSAPTTPTPTPTPTPSPPDTGTDPKTMLAGIDVSHWQNTIDWTQVAAAGKKFAFIKASESTDFVDPLYATNRAAAKAAGLRIGAYHFGRPTATQGDGKAEADHFIDTATPVSGELPPVLDLEVSGGLATANLQAWVKSFMDEVAARTGVKGVIYVSPSFWKNYLGDTTWFADNGYQVLWIAHWTSADLPTLPANNWSNEGWTFWQYTSSGTVPGISGRVDLDRFNGTDLRPYLIP